MDEGDEELWGEQLIQYIMNKINLSTSNTSTDDRTWWEYMNQFGSGSENGSGLPPLSNIQLTNRIIESFHQFDNYYIENIARNAYQAGYGGVASVGSCVCIAMLNRERKQLVISNLGDCRAIVGTTSTVDTTNTVTNTDTTAVTTIDTDSHSHSHWNAIQVTHDHNARMPTEQAALCTAHPQETLDQLVRCKSSTACYVKGRLQLTRALGDLYLKSSEFNANSGLHRSRYV